MINPENSFKKPQEKNQNLKDAINTLKFFDHRIRQEVKNREKQKTPTSSR